MSIAALIFDVDGTLADTEELHRKSFNDAFDRVGLPWRWTPRRYGELLKTTGGKERIAAYLHSLEMPRIRRASLQVRIPDIHRFKTAAYKKRMLSATVELRHGVRRLIAEARQAGVRLAIASTTTRESIDALLSVTLGEASSRWFDVIATGDDAPSKKPAPDIYFLALDALGVRADECIAFEDSGRGLASSRGAGIFTVVTPTYWTRDDNFLGADVVVAHLGDEQHPLGHDDEQRIGHAWLGLDQLESLLAQHNRNAHAAPLRRAPGGHPRDIEGRIKP
jgi:HAD superfamily hydrolase (TIGR01509 family)